MRITDSYIQKLFLNNLNTNKAEMQKLQYQIATQSSINKISDSPLGASRVMKLNDQLNSISAYKKNIDYGTAFIDRTIGAMEGVQSEIQKLLTELTKVNNATTTNQFSTFAGNIDLFFKSILDFANDEYDGKYLFGGTDFSSLPFSYSSSNNSLSANANIDGNLSLKISKNISQKINITGEEIFVPLLKQAGNFTKNSPVGFQLSNSNFVYDADGNKYSINVLYTKTDDNNYKLDYNISDSNNNQITTGTKNLIFDSATGVLKTINGSSPAKIKIELDSPKLNFKMDVSSLTETNNSTSVNSAMNMQGDIFNTILSVKKNLLNGIKPNTNQVNLIKDFNKHLLNKISEAGNINLRLNDTTELLQNEEMSLKEILSKEKDVDVAQAVMNYQNKQQIMEMLYKMSSNILSKSLVDYL